MLTTMIDLLIYIAAAYGLYCAIRTVVEYRPIDDSCVNTPVDGETRIVFYEGRGYLPEIYVAADRAFNAIGRDGKNAFDRKIAFAYDDFHKTEAAAAAAMNTYCTRTLSEPQIVWSQSGAIGRRMSKDKQLSES